MGVVTTSLVIEFDQGLDDTGILLAEIDAFPNGLNKGITSFAPGDSPGFLLYMSSNVVVDSIQSSEGVVSSLGGGVTPEPIEENLIFTDKNKTGVTYPISSGFTSKQLGDNYDLGSITHTETEVFIQNVGVGVVHVEYTANYRKYRLNGVPSSLNGETSFPIIIFITGHTV